MGGDGITTGALIENNIVYENGVAGGAGINLASVRDSTIRNNLVYHNYAGGISGWGDGNGPDWGCKDNAIYNNTVFFRPGEGRYAISLKEGSTGNHIRNNILCGGGRGGLEYDDDAIASSLQMDYNLLYSASGAVVVTKEDAGYYNLGQWQALWGQDSHSLTAAPAVVFVAAAGGDFHLAPASPARQAGDPAPQYRNRDGSRNDLGAYGGPNALGRRLNRGTAWRLLLAE